MNYLTLINGTYTFETSGASMLFDLGAALFRVKAGSIKFHTRPSIGGFGIEVKDEPSAVSGTHYGIECTVDAKPSTATSQAGIRGGGFIGRLKSTYTMTGGSLIGGYSQACNNGTLNGSGIFVAGHYALLEAGGTFTEVSHISGLWVDSHLTQTISAGKSELVYLTNNGSTVFDNVFFVYAGNNITNLFEIDNSADGNMVSDPVTSDYTFTKTRLVKVKVGGETGYVVVDVP